jgi:hypothetical protein
MALRGVAADYDLMAQKLETHELRGKVSPKAAFPSVAAVSRR